MADLTTEFKYGKLTVLYSAAQLAGKTLRVYLTETLVTADAAIQSGDTLLSNTGNGQTWTRQPSIGSLNPVIAFELISEFLRRLDIALTNLSADGIPTPSEAQIFSKMCDGLEVITEPMQDRSGWSRW